MKLCITLLTISLVLSTNSIAQNENRDEQFQQLVDFLSIPNIAANVNDINDNIKWLEREFKESGFDTKLMKNEGNDVFFASVEVDNKKPTVLFYMHFDGQPIDTAKWAQDHPFKPVIKYKKDELKNMSLNWQKVKNMDLEQEDVRIYARSSSDDKGPVIMFLSAFNELKKQGKEPRFNIKIILDSMEEVGSPFLESLVIKSKEDLQSDFFVAFDGPMHDSGNPTLLYGGRGITEVTLEVYGLNRPQHSGHFGNYGPNPVFRASHILNSLKDQNGRVLVDGYYDGIELDDQVNDILKSVPDDANKIRERAGFSKPEMVADTYQGAMQYPSLNVRGIQSGWVGSSARTIVPDKVIVEMDIRTVPESNPDSLVNKLKTHIKDLGYTLLDKPATKEDLMSIEKPVYFKYSNSMFPFRTEMDSQIGSWLRNSVKQKGQETVQIRISGGSVPLSFFINALDVPTVLVPLVNPDNNQHSPNENLRLSYYFKGIETIKRVLTTPIK